MIRWLITILIRMAPDYKSSNTPIKGVEEDKMMGLGSAILKESTSEAIVDRCTMIFNWLRSLTDLIVLCCKHLGDDGARKDIIPVEFKAVDEMVHDSAKDAVELEVRSSRSFIIRTSVIRTLQITNGF